MNINEKQAIVLKTLNDKYKRRKRIKMSEDKAAKIITKWAKEWIQANRPNLDHNIKKKKKQMEKKQKKDKRHRRQKKSIEEIQVDKIVDEELRASDNTLYDVSGITENF